MADEREFTTLPRRALGDRRLSGMDLRVLGAISLHDGLSLAKGKGQGCYAGDRKLAQTANTDRKNVKRSTARLIEYGYLTRDTDTLNRRGFVVRVIPDSMATDTIGGQLAPSQQGVNSPPIGGQLAPSIGGQLAPRIDKGIEPEENHRIDSAKLHSAQSAPCEQVQEELGRGDRVSILALLPKRFNDFATETQLVMFERAFTKIDRNADAITSEERKKLEGWLFAAADAFAGEQLGYQAQRLLEEFAPNAG
ncbi:hypothetical protein [Croceibacterium aestuarii]|uniref:hypothetical protein n=1 Tax=Croceibacterium aestuarii TaxID=3064139 RepID=UPI00272EC197|nr:hypothetical protein [Croceibacterium sp. D39]